MKLFVWEMMREYYWCALANSVEEAREILKEKHTTMDEKSRKIVDGRPRVVLGDGRQFTVFGEVPQF